MAASSVGGRSTVRTCMLPLLPQGGGPHQQPLRQPTGRLQSQTLKCETTAWASSGRLRKAARTSPWVRRRSSAGHLVRDVAVVSDPAEIRATGQQSYARAARNTAGDARRHPVPVERPATTGTVNTTHQLQLESPQRMWASRTQHSAFDDAALVESSGANTVAQSRPRPRTVAAAVNATRRTQRAVTALAARPSFGSRAGKTLVLSPELAKYRELVRGMMAIDVPCSKCRGQFVQAKRCKACSGTGKQLPEPELLLWRWPHNHRAWSKVIAKLGKGWAAALPHEDWIGFKKITNHGSTVLRVGGANLLHNKRLLFEALLAAGDAVAPYIPETYCVSTHYTYCSHQHCHSTERTVCHGLIGNEQTHNEFVEAASQPSPETINEGGGPCQGVGDGCEFSGPCDDIWYFKRSVDDNGRGLVIFKGVLSEEDIMDQLEERDAVRRESKKKAAGPRGFKVKSRKAASAKRKSIGGEGVLDGVYQRCGELRQTLQWLNRDEVAMHRRFVCFRRMTRLWLAQPRI